MLGMPSRGTPITHPAPPSDSTCSGLSGPRPAIPVPWSSEIFSSSVISFITIEARSSGERLVFIQGKDLDDWANACDKHVKISTMVRATTGRRNARRGMNDPLLERSECWSDLGASNLLPEFAAIDRGMHPQLFWRADRCKLP